MSQPLILASASPRRSQILTELGVQFKVISADIDERVLKGELAEDYVIRLAVKKCSSVFLDTDKNSAVLGSDTSVVIDNLILGKPSCEEQAVQTLMALSGKWHQVVTAVAVIDRCKIEHFVVTSNVQFCELNEQLCRTYWQTGEPADKAGSYAIQGKGSRFVKQIQGSYSAIVGLPAVETAEILQRFDVKTWSF
jgi:septum formation protein